MTEVHHEHSNEGLALTARVRLRRGRRKRRRNLRAQSERGQRRSAAWPMIILAQVLSSLSVRPAALLPPGRGPVFLFLGCSSSHRASINNSSLACFSRRRFKTAPTLQNWMKPCQRGRHNAISTMQRPQFWHRTEPRVLTFIFRKVIWVYEK